WAGYFFEGSYNAGADSGSSNIPAMVDNDCVRIDSANLVEKFGHGIVRREGSAPAYYLKMDSRLVQAQNSFSFACWVFRSGDSKANEECLLELGGSEGILRFAPYAVGADGVSVAYVEYTDSRGNIQHGMIPSNASSAATGAWVHYTLTVAYNGAITVYVNGVASAVFASGVSPAALNYEDCRVVTGASSSDPTRTVIDEVYFAPQVLSAAEVRKIHYYGLQRYTTEVLPDPGSGGGGVGPGVLAPDDTDISEDAYNKIGAIANGFIGTTFDDRVAVGRDWNNSADATVTGERLTTGISSYALSMDGSSSFLRYPMGILDGVTSFTVSLSYSWAGTTSATTRSQRLFDFSRKASSVSEPTAYIYLETGLGFGGLKFGMSDGINSTFLTYDYNETNTWTRVTVTVANGTATLYVNDQAVDSVATNVSVSSICPNFCYVGRSGVKGDPLFKGAVDEIYISNTALSENEVGKWMKGISAAINGEDLNEDDGWSTMIVVIIVVAVLLVIGVVVTVVLMITKREKKPKAEIPPMPSPRPGMNNASEPVLGPRSARRARMEAEGAESEATMKFRKVKDDTAESAPDPSATTEFRKVTPDEPAEDETAVFRKIDTDNSDSTK
ncbi:MAG: hypothetical protein IJC19_02835, partial [Clostridia bacterium]|nr:hypothetical protein [Clostridia bacterium]